MNITDDMLMAFADGELDLAAREAVETALRDDPALAARIARHRALRSMIQRSFAAELDEPVPQRLLLGARGGARSSRAAAARPRPQFAAWRRRPLMAMAASLLLGLALGPFLPREFSSLATKDGAVIAQGSLAKALSTQLGGEGSSDVKIGVSFLSKSGDYCRTFSIAGQTSSSGLACRAAAEWRIQVLQAAAGGAGGSVAQYRTAGSSLPPVILGAVQQQIDGDPLDEQGEIAARQRGWLPRR